jgi:iron(III) transport system substrate-binding protein
VREAAAQSRVSKVHDFQTAADVAKAEQEGELVYYGHDGEAGIGTLLDAFKKDFPKIKTSYTRLQTGALYAKITAERSAGRFQCDVLQLSDISPAVDFQKKGGWDVHQSPELRRVQEGVPVEPVRPLHLGRRDVRRDLLQQGQGHGRAGAQGTGRTS